MYLCLKNFTRVRFEFYSLIGIEKCLFDNELQHSGFSLNAGFFVKSTSFKIIASSLHYYWSTKHEK